MKVLKIVAATTGGLLAINAAANLTIRKAQTSASVWDMVRDAARTVVTPAVVTYRNASVNAA